MNKKTTVVFLGIVLGFTWACGLAWPDDTANSEPVSLRAAEDEVAARQSVDTFSSIEDAQPGLPGGFELNLNAGWERYDDDYDPFFAEPEFAYTGSGSPFLQNMQLLLSVPFELGEGEVEGNGDANLGWQQRWVAEHDGWPTLGTLLELRLPTGVDSDGVDVTLMGILAKDAGPGTVYTSIWGTSVGGTEDDEEDFVWGAQLGYKWRLNEQWALVGDYLHRSSEAEDGHDGDFLEVAAEYHATDRLTIGPGVQVGLGNEDDQPDFGVGIRVNYAF